MFTGFNWIDFVIVAVTIYFVFDGWERGMVAQVANLLAFLASLWLAIRYHSIVGGFVTQKFGITPMWAEAIGYISIAFIAELILEEIIKFFLRKLPEKIANSKINHMLGGLVSVISGLVTITFFLLLFLAFPLRGTIKNDIRSSRVASYLIKAANAYGGKMSSSVDTLANEAAKFVTIEPGSNENLRMDFPPLSPNLPIDAQAELSMISLVNKERAAKGIHPLRIDTRMSAVAEAKSRDMFAKNYFAHTDGDGKNVGDHMREAAIEYTVVGENLAFAPDTQTAHNGLMNSPGHKANILDPVFYRIGIGVIDAGIYGKMYTQVFAD